MGFVLNSKYERIYKKQQKTYSDLQYCCVGNMCILSQHWLSYQVFHRHMLSGLRNDKSVILFFKAGFCNRLSDAPVNIYYATCCINLYIQKKFSAKAFENTDSSLFRFAGRNLHSAFAQRKLCCVH